MVHIPSFMVGSSVSATGFLMIHKELSHRERLSKKWKIQEYIEAQIHELITAAKMKGGKEINLLQSPNNTNEWMSPRITRENMSKSWNEGLDNFKGFLEKRVFSNYRNDKDEKQ